MVNKQLLMAELIRNGYTQSSFCKKIGIPISRFNRKLNDRAAFDTIEIKTIASELGINDCKLLCDIFLQ